jgi:hypothetical protein
MPIYRVATVHSLHIHLKVSRPQPVNPIFGIGNYIRDVNRIKESTAFAAGTIDTDNKHITIGINTFVVAKYCGVTF